MKALRILGIGLAYLVGLVPAGMFSTWLHDWPSGPPVAGTLVQEVVQENELALYVLGGFVVYSLAFALVVVILKQRSLDKATQGNHSEVSTF